MTTRLHDSLARVCFNTPNCPKRFQVEIFCFNCRVKLLTVNNSVHMNMDRHTLTSSLPCSNKLRLCANKGPIHCLPFRIKQCNLNFYKLYSTSNSYLLHLPLKQFSRRAVPTKSLGVHMDVSDLVLET